MESQIKTYSFSDGTIQRVQTAVLEGWEYLEFLELCGEANGLDCFAGIFRQYLIPACPWIFGNLLLFSLPKDVEVPVSREMPYASSLTSAAALLTQGVRILRGKPGFRNRETELLWKALEERDCIRIVSGKLPTTQIIPVGNAPGFLSETLPDAAIKANASFFIMDPFDCATVFDHVGIPLGLMVKNGRVLNPPLYGREALLVKADGTATVENWDIRDLPVQIGGITYRHGENCRIETRPRHRCVWGKGTKLVIVGGRVEAVCQGVTPVPASGFVLAPQGKCLAKPGDLVSYPAMEDVVFGIQVGNSILRDGVKTEKFLSKFYNIRRLEPVPYPPSLYPMNFEKSRAARMALGADADGKPKLLWAEGAPKLGYIPGQHSRGASLADMGTFCADAGMVQAVNLDGGGSAQMLIRGRRLLEISDRNPDGTQSERLIPNALVVK